MTEVQLDEMDKACNTDLETNKCIWTVFGRTRGNRMLETNVYISNDFRQRSCDDMSWV